MAKYGEYIPLEVPRISLTQNFIPNIRQVKNQASAIQNIRKDRSERREELLASRPDLAQAISDVAFSSLQPRQRAQGAGLHELWGKPLQAGSSSVF